MVATRGQRCRLASEGLQAALGRESGLQAVRVPRASAGVSGAALHLGSPHLFSFVVPAGKILPTAAKLKLKEAPVFPDPPQPVGPHPSGPLPRWILPARALGHREEATCPKPCTRPGLPRPNWVAGGLTLQTHTSHNPHFPSSREPESVTRCPVGDRWQLSDQLLPESPRLQQ